MAEVFKKTDEDFLKQATKTKPSWKDGTTAIVVLVLQNIIYICNLGDSKVRIVIFFMFVVLNIILFCMLYKDKCFQFLMQKRHILTLYILFSFRQFYVDSTKIPINMSLYLSVLIIPLQIIKNVWGFRKQVDVFGKYNFFIIWCFHKAFLY